MVQYLKEFLEEMSKELSSSENGEGVWNRFEVVIEEFNRLDPRDFEPKHRHEFVILRMRSRMYSQLNRKDWKHLYNRCGDAR